ncbi:hypothetical protein Pcinc_022665 [Petrolisthes cinctipes]|uniref:Large ribosomal subunit protein uL14m n=1 Tax=Petrolisthes cinctipes TaxID=88211 RepID=A0AAE1FHA3_PETCI|nr:hypothetical protein Pcinc_022665 [Petrolisthes cinctipes]
MNVVPAILRAARCGEGSRLHTSSSLQHIQKQTRLRVVDNSELGKSAMLEGRPPRCIHVYNKKGIGRTGDKVLVAIKGQKKQAILTGCHQDQFPLMPKFDSNNIVLVDENGSPLGTRIHVPIPTFLRKKLTDMSRPKENEAKYCTLPFLIDHS